MKTYKSEIGFFSYLFAILTSAIIILSLIFALLGSVSIQETIFMLFAYILVTFAYYSAVLYPLFNTKYVIENEKLTIRSGYYKKTVLCNQIVEIIEKESFGREPALSTRRLYIQYRDGQGIYWIGISPVDREDFLKNIECRPYK